MEKVALFVTCVVDHVVPDAGVAVVEVLRAAGCDVVVPRGQTCCGQPAWNSGFVDEAAAVARTTLDALEASDADVVVVPAGSCATMVRLFWGQLFGLAGDAATSTRAKELASRTKEFTEYVAGRDLTLDRDTPQAAVAYHHSCHMNRELHLHDPPEQLLAAAGCAAVDWDADRCCGFGGTFSVKLPETSVAMADEKLRTLPADVGTIVGADSSCLLHLQSRSAATGRPVRIRHIAEVLADRLGGEAG